MFCDPDENLLGPGKFSLISQKQLLFNLRSRALKQPRRSAPVDASSTARPKWKPYPKPILPHAVTKPLGLLSNGCAIYKAAARIITREFHARGDDATEATASTAQDTRKMPEIMNAATECGQPRITHICTLAAAQHAALDAPMRQCHDKLPRLHTQVPR